MTKTNLVTKLKEDIYLDDSVHPYQLLSYATHWVIEKSSNSKFINQDFGNVRDWKTNKIVKENEQLIFEHEEKENSSYAKMDYLIENNGILFNVIVSLYEGPRKRTGRCQVKVSENFKTFKKSDCPNIFKDLAKKGRNGVMGKVLEPHFPYIHSGKVNYSKISKRSLTPIIVFHEEKEQQNYQLAKAIAKDLLFEAAVIYEKDVKSNRQGFSEIIYQDGIKKEFSISKNNKSEIIENIRSKYLLT